MKRMNCLLIAIVMFTLLTGCAGENRIANNRHYSIEKDGDSYFLLLKKSHESTYAEGMMIAAPSVKFSSVAEMKNDILTGNFSEDELRQIDRFNKDDTGKTILFNMERLYEPELPNGIDISYVTWAGSVYSFYAVECAAFQQISIRKPTKERFDELLAEYNDNGGHEVRQSKDGRNAIEYSYRAPSGADVKIVKYTIPCDDKTVYVMEIYNCTELHTPFAKETLKHIDLYIESAGRYTEVSILYPKTRPSVEWLSQFGMKEYVESKVS